MSLRVRAPSLLSSSTGPFRGYIVKRRRSDGALALEYVVHRHVPCFLAGLGVEGDEMAILGTHKHQPFSHGQAARAPSTGDVSLRTFVDVIPEQLARGSVRGVHVVLH